MSKTSFLLSLCGTPYHVPYPPLHTHTHTRALKHAPPIHLVSFLIGSEADKIAVSEEEEDEHVEEVEEVEVT